MNNNELQILNFARKITPTPLERNYGVTDDQFIDWGIDNLYPDFLLQLYGEVPLHASAITSKVDYIKGDGLVIKGDNTPANFQVSVTDTLEEFANKLVYDYVIFNFFCVEVQYNIFGKPFRFNHVPAHKVRINRNRTLFGVCDDWIRKGQILSYDVYRPNVINPNGASKLFFYTGYVPTVNMVYPDVKYKSGITSMITDMMVNDFNKNNLEDGFSAAHVISFFKGIPTDQEAREFEKKFAERYSGANGRKYIINYNNTDVDKSVAIDSIDSGDFADKLVNLNAKVETNILTAHQATSPLIFGIKTEGQLGGATEYETGYELFKNVWVKSNRNIVERGLNNLFLSAGLPEIEFKDKSTLFSQTLDTTTREKVLTIDELRARDGYAPLPNGAGAVLIAQTTPAANIVQPVSPNQPTNTGDFEDLEKKKSGRKLIADDFDKVSHLGLHRGNYHVLKSGLKRSTRAGLKFDADSDLENYLMDNDLTGKSLSEIADEIKKALGIDISVSDLTDHINALADAGILESKIEGGVVKDFKPTENNVKEVLTMYEYRVREGYGADLLPTSRDFCVKLIENDKLYSLEDIQTMSDIFGYNVLKHCGGWYMNADGVAENQCRHQWSSVRVVRKNNND